MTWLVVTACAAVIVAAAAGSIAATRPSLDREPSSELPTPGPSAAVPNIGPSPRSFAPGTDATFDSLWDACAAGDALRCDYLYLASPLNSEYEQFGLTCGDRVDGEGFSCFTRNFTSDGDATGGDSGELPPAIV